MVDNPEVMTKKEVADFLKYNARTVDYLIATGQIPFSRIGKRGIRFKRSRLLAWMDEREGVEFRLPRQATSK